ncbi:MAG TPA: hypothetical protein VKU00_13815 [Chthonomonadaceae bacterium]|nr:hypothetical protein [Chthonomonadaceae bacterium]
MKISNSVAAGILVVVAIVAIVFGVMYIRHQSGSDVADQIHDIMAKTPPGTGPMSHDQIEEMKRQHSTNPATQH